MKKNQKERKNYINGENKSIKSPETLFSLAPSMLTLDRMEGLWLDFRKPETSALLNSVKSFKSLHCGWNLFLTRKTFQICSFPYTFHNNSTCKGLSKDWPLTHPPLPSTSKISSVILLTFYHTIHMLLVRWIWYCINQQPPIIDIFIYCHHLSAWYCIDIVRRNTVLVIRGNQRVKEKTPFSFSFLIKHSQRMKKKTVNIIVCSPTATTSGKYRCREIKPFPEGRTPFVWSTKCQNWTFLSSFPTHELLFGSSSIFECFSHSATTERIGLTTNLPPMYNVKVETGGSIEALFS